MDQSQEQIQNNNDKLVMNMLGDIDICQTHNVPFEYKCLNEGCDNQSKYCEKCIFENHILHIEQVQKIQIEEIMEMGKNRQNLQKKQIKENDLINSDYIFDQSNNDQWNKSIKDYIIKSNIKFTENQIPFKYINDFNNLRRKKKELVTKDQQIYYGNINQDRVPHGIGQLYSFDSSFFESKENSHCFYYGIFSNGNILFGHLIFIMKEPTILNNINDLSQMIEQYFNENFIHYYGYFNKGLPHDQNPLMFDRFGQRIEMQFQDGQKIGQLKKYNLNGHLTKTVEYIDDNIQQIQIHYSDQINPNKMQQIKINLQYQMENEIEWKPIRSSQEGLVERYNDNKVEQ